MVLTTILAKFVSLELFFVKHTFVLFFDLTSISQGSRNKILVSIRKIFIYQRVAFTEPNFIHPAKCNVDMPCRVEDGVCCCCDESIARNVVFASMC